MHPSTPVLLAFVALLGVLGAIAGRFFAYAVSTAEAGTQKSGAYTFVWVGMMFVVFALLAAIGELYRSYRFDDAEVLTGVGCGVLSTAVAFYFGRRKWRRR